MDLKIEARNVTMTPRWKAEIEERATDLRELHPELTHARVILTKNSHHKQGEQVAEALVTVNFPKRHTVTARKENKTFEEAMRAAFAAVKTELKKFREKRSSTEVRNPPPSFEE